MYARSTIGILAAVALALSGQPASRFTLDSIGAIRLSVAGPEARYGVVPAGINLRPVLTISLGATSAQGALQLAMPGDRMPAAGRYAIRSDWTDLETEEQAFHASFVAGSPEHSLGWFHGESGSVTITQADGGRMSGTFEVRARGFLSADPADEDRWVTVLGTFDAQGDTTAATIATRQ